MALFCHSFCFDGWGEALKYGPFMAALRKGEPKHVYLLAGEEHYYIEKAKAAILESLFPAGEGLRDALEEAAPDMDADALIGLLETVPFFVSKHVVLVQDSPLFREKKRPAADGEEAGAAKGKKGGADKKEERLLHLLADMPDYAYVIFLCAGKADKRRKAYKAVEAAGAALDADAVRPWEIGDWLAGKLAEIHREFDREAHAYFMGAVSMMHEVSLSYLDKEFEKLALYTAEKRIGRAELAAVFSGLPEVSSFAMLDAVSEKDVKKALTLLRRQTADGVYAPVLLALMVRHVRQLWQAKLLLAQGVRGKALGPSMKLNPFIAEKLGRASMKFSEPVLKRAMLSLIDADYLLKTGRGGVELLEDAVISLCR